MKQTSERLGVKIVGGLKEVNTAWALPQVEKYLRPGISLAQLDAIANQMSDNQCAERMVKARSNLYKQTNRYSCDEANRLPPGSFFD